MKRKYDWTGLPHSWRYLATDMNGRTYWYYCKPLIRDGVEHWLVNDKSKAGNLYGEATGIKPQYKMSWDMSMEKRPTQ